MRKAKHVIIGLAIALSVTQIASAHELNRRQKKIADEITAFCTDNWEKYGVLPSTCITQGFMETTLGEACNNNNLWGISSNNYSGFPTLEHGIKRYCEVVNYDYYKNAPFQLDPKVQIRIIVDGGYCTKAPDVYFKNACWSIDHYGFGKYDKPLKRKLAAKKREKNQKGSFVVVYDPTIPEHEIVISDKVAKKGTVLLWRQNELQGIYDVVTDKDIQSHTLKINEPYLALKRVKIEVKEYSKG